MLTRRKVRRSIRDQVGDILAFPPAETGVAGYNVYGATEMATLGFIPVRPYVFLLDVRTSKDITLLKPTIAIQARSTAVTFELGNFKRARIFSVGLAIIGQTSGEAEDIADLIETYLTTVPIFDYAVSGNPIIGHGTVSDLIDVDPVIVDDEQIFEGTLTYMINLAFALEVQPL